jgi:hypothetical protein
MICNTPSLRIRKGHEEVYHEEGVGGLDEALLLVL